MNVQSSSNFAAALRYARQGFKVLLVYPLREGACTCRKGAKCTSPGKHAMQSDWPRKATTDENEIRAMLRKHPSAHIGVMPPENHVIIDVDPRNGGLETLAKLTGKQTPAFNTPTQRSGGGGLHFVFKGERRTPLGKGIDVKRAGRGYVVAWPSAHVSGGAYRWAKGKAPWEVSVAPLPAVLCDREADSSSSAPAEPAVRTKVTLAQVREALAYVDADDYHRWINVGQALKYNYGDDGLEVWLDWSQTSDKWQEGDTRKWDSFDHNRDRSLITVRSIISMARRGGYRPLATEFEHSLWIEGDIRELLTTPAPPIDWVFEPCLPGGKVSVLSGAGGSSKSYMVLTLALHLAVGVAFGPFKPSKPGKALLLVAEEQRDDVHRRLRAMLADTLFDDAQIKAIGDRVAVVPTRGLDWRLVENDEAGNVQETDRVDYLIEQVNLLGGDIRLVVIDPLVAFNGVSENDNVQMARLMFTLDRVAANTGAAVLVLHHMSKMGQVQSLNDVSQAIVRGASALVDNARSVMLMMRMPRAEAPLFNVNADDAGRFIVLRVAKNNYGPHTADAVFAVNNGGTLRPAPEVQRVHASQVVAARAQDAMDGALRVARAIRDNPRASQRQIATATGISATRVNQHLHGLVENGFATRTGTSTRSTWYALTQQGFEMLGVEMDDIM